MPARKANPSNRVTWTLGLLVICMSVGFGALNWLHNLSAAGRNAPRALSAVRNPQAWSGIVVHPITWNERNLPFHHFHVDSHGTEQFTAAWRQNRHDADNSRSIHVVMELPRKPGITRRQWETVVARLRTLQARYEIPDRAVTLDLAEPRVSAAVRADAIQLQRMFRTTGWAR